ncbi:MAG: pyridoxamine 5'-phosphate oxidase family protein [Campylobacterota bacterium]|nr:pyridoxamine 5'-phosphate oxidase family protein [Campylobacterota bacterium]
MKLMMKKEFEIDDQEIISKILDEAQYGTLALCAHNKPYSLPINFVEIDNQIYFHGAKKGKKIDFLKENSFASFSVVESYSMIQSYFSSTKGLACPATHFFKSVIIDGQIEFIDNYDEKVLMLDQLMVKLQPEGNYKPLDKEVYTKAINATTIYKLVPQTTKAKFKFGQNLTEERFDMIIEHLQNRAQEKDIATIKLMKEFKKARIL